MQNFLTDVRDFINDRIGSPFWLSTILSWFFWNWEISITMIFQTSDFSANTFRQYLSETCIAYHLGLPVLSGLLYSILSGSLRETLEVGARYARSWIIRLDSSGKLYTSISIQEHNKKIERLNRELERVYIKIEDTDALKAKNDSLLHEIENIRTTEREISDLIRSQVIEKDLDDPVKKMRFIKSLHDKGFAFGISDDDIPDQRGSNQNEDSEADNINENEVRRAYIKTNKDDLSDTTLHENEPREFDTDYNALQKSMSDNLVSELKNPKSLTTILATLLLAKASSQIKLSLSPSLMGLETEAFSECVESLSKAKLVAIGDKNLALTSAGRDRIKKLLVDLEGHELIELLKRTETLLRQQIVRHLKRNSLTRQDIYKNSVFHPYLPEIISEMIKSGEISEEGSLLFLNIKTTTN